MARAPRRASKNPQAVLPSRLLTRQRTATDASVLDRGREVLNRQDYNHRTDIRQLKSLNEKLALVRELSRLDGHLSTAVFQTVQTAHTRYRYAAYDMNHQFSAAGTHLAETIVSRMNTVWDYSSGYSSRRSVSSLVETLLRESAINSGVGLELVLDDARLPDRLVPVDVSTVIWVSDGRGGQVPKQRYPGAREDIDLNLPNVWFEFSHLDAGKIYTRSMYEAAVKDSLQYGEFIDDIRRVVRQSGHTRLAVALDVDKIMAVLPASVKNDPEQLDAELKRIKAQVEADLRQMNPEDAIVHFTIAKPEHLQSGLGSRSDYTPLLKTMAGSYSTSMKTPPSVLGLRLDGGSEALGNIETLLFMKTAAAIQLPVAAVMSRALTLACRLYGMDVYVEFEFDPINLRPEDELEAFRAMHQARVLELLSLGFVTDDEAGYMLGTGERAPGAPALSGTLFWGQVGGKDLQTVDPYNTPVKDTPAGRGAQPDENVPRKAGGRSQ